MKEWGRKTKEGLEEAKERDKRKRGTLGLLPLGSVTHDIDCHLLSGDQHAECATDSESVNSS